MTESSTRDNICATPLLDTQLQEYEESDAIMRIHGRPHYGQRLLVKAFSSCMSIGSNLLTPFRKSYRKWRTLMKNSFLAKKSAIITQVRSFFRSFAIKRRKDHVISQDTGEKSPTYIVGDTDSTSKIAESGAIFADPEPAEGSYEGLPLKSPQDNLKRKAPTSMDSKPGKFLRLRRAAGGNISDRFAKGTSEPGPSQVEMPDSQHEENMKNLSSEHYSILMSKGKKGKLVDDIISKAQELLQNQFAGFDGLQPPCALLVPGYTVQQKAVQIHYDSERDHWMTTCYKNGNIMVADSISKRNLSPSIRDQINNIYSDVLHEPLKHVRYLRVDQQKNPNDCGLFAIANAYEFLADGGNPRAKYQPRKMRNHLITCLQNGRFTPFPKSVRK